MYSASQYSILQNLITLLNALTTCYFMKIFIMVSFHGKLFERNILDIYSVNYPEMNEWIMA